MKLKYDIRSIYYCQYVIVHTPYFLQLALALN